MKYNYYYIFVSILLVSSLSYFLYLLSLILKSFSFDPPDQLVKPFTTAHKFIYILTTCIATKWVTRYLPILVPIERIFLPAVFQVTPQWNYNAPATFSLPTHSEQTYLWTMFSFFIHQLVIKALFLPSPHSHRYELLESHKYNSDEWHEILGYCFCTYFHFWPYPCSVSSLDLLFSLMMYCIMSSYDLVYLTVWNSWWADLGVWSFDFSRSEITFLLEFRNIPDKCCLVWKDAEVFAPDPWKIYIVIGDCHNLHKASFPMIEASHPIGSAKNCGQSSRTIFMTAWIRCRTVSCSELTSKLYASRALGQWIKIAFLSVEYLVSRTCKGLTDDWVSCLVMIFLRCNNFSFVFETMCQHAPDDMDLFIHLNFKVVGP